MTTPHHDEPEMTNHLDRRNFLKKGAVAGATGITAPLLVQSVLSPAAACSGPSLTPSVLVGPGTGVAWEGTANGVSGYSTSTTFTVLRESRLMIAFVFHWLDNDGPFDPNNIQGNLAVTASNTNITGITLVNSKMFDSSPVLNNESYTLYVYTAVNATTADQVTSLTMTMTDPAIGTGNSSDGSGFLGHVLQIRENLADPTVVPSIAGSAFGPPTTANSTTASVTLAPAADEATFLATASRGDMAASFAWSSTAIALRTTQRVNDGSDEDLSLGTFFTSGPVTNPSATQSEAELWGAVGVSIGC